MSVHRENVTWQSKDGSWNLGFYTVYPGDFSDPDYDFEWDVDYGADFEWVSTGHSSPEAADSSWTGANPGGGTWVAYKDNKQESEDLDFLALCFQKPEAAKKIAAKNIRARLRKIVKDEGITAGTYVEILRAQVRALPMRDQIGGGMVTYGKLVQEGDWLGIKEDNKLVKFFNTKTNTPHAAVINASKREEPKRSYYSPRAYW